MANCPYRKVLQGLGIQSSWFLGTDDEKYAVIDVPLVCDGDNEKFAFMDITLVYDDDEAQPEILQGPASTIL